MCTTCVYIDSVSGNDSSGDGSTSLPYATIAAAQKAAGTNVDGAVLRGTFVPGKEFRYKAWSSMRHAM